MSGEQILVAVPNISEGRDHALVAGVAGPDHLLDVHSDPQHNRSVLTYGGRPDEVGSACAAMLGRAVERLDLTRHDGAHPRFGVVDVLPFVVHPAPEPTALEAAEALAAAATVHGLPVYLYDRGSADRRTLPELRRRLRSIEPPPPDAGPPIPDPTAGVVCIGVRGPLVAFNVHLRAPAPASSLRTVAAHLRTLRGVRALAFPALRQLSMNLVEPAVTGPRQAFDAARLAAGEHGLEVVDCEIVGLVPGALLDQTRDLPLRAPVRSVEDALGG